MEARRGIVTGGTWCVDRNIVVEYWPSEDGLVEILSSETQNGGSGSNLAIDIKRLDPAMPVETIGLVGDDADGRLLVALADRFGIGRAQLQMTGAEATQYTHAYASKRSGRRTHIYYQGTAALLTPRHFDLECATGRIFHLGLPGVHRVMDAPWEGDANGWVTVLKEARRCGFLTNLELVSAEPERVRALIGPCLPHLDYLIVNDHEIGALAEEATVGDGITDVEACRRAAEAVMARGPMRLVAVHFPRGAVAITRDGATARMPSVRVPQAAVVGANGAGDAFAAGMIYGVHEGWSLERSVALAHATAAASLRAAATCDSVETWERCLALADGWGWNDPV